VGLRSISQKLEVISIPLNLSPTYVKFAATNRHAVHMNYRWYSTCVFKLSAIGVASL
jgi:hypothetical protein